MKALVYKSTGSWYVVKTDTGKVYNARIKGALRMEGLTSTNPIAVGDEVTIEPENEVDPTAIVQEILPRRNYVTRQSPGHKMHHHIIASNLHQSLLFATLRDPKTSQGFMDRYLVTCEAYHIPAIIVFNKSDVYREKEMERFEEVSHMYEEIGYKTVLMSLEKGTGVEEVKQLLKDKTTLISGHSGVGKSTFINSILPEMKKLKTQDVSGWSGKGMHTTTFAEMFDLPFGGRIIDTPGVREFGLVDISRQELSHYFPEMAKLINDCQFNNCQHINEPGCAVKKAVEDGEIAEERFFSYYSILESIGEKNY